MRTEGMNTGDVGDSRCATYRLDRLYMLPERRLVYARLLQRNLFTYQQLALIVRELSLAH